MSVKRLHVDWVSMEQDQNGELVLYSEHADAIEKLEAENAALKEENEQLNYMLGRQIETSHSLAAEAIEAGALKARVAELEHAANEWADACINGLQHLKNIRDGISLASDAIPNMEQCIEHCQSVWADALKEPANEG